MYRELILSSCKLFILILICNFFSRGQELKSFLNTPFQNCWESSERITTKLASDNDNRIFIPLQFGTIKAIDLSKNEVWTTEVGGEIIGQPIYYEKILYVLSKVNPVSDSDTKESGGTVYSISALDTDSGIGKWKREYRSEQIPEISLHKDRLVIVLTKKDINSGGKTSSFSVSDRHTGIVIFEKNYNSEIKQFLDTSKEIIVMLTSLNTIFSFSVLDGNTVSSNTSIKGIQTGSIFGKGFLLSNDRGSIYFVELTGRENKLKIRLGAKAANIINHKNSILVSSLDNFIYSISSDGKQINWKRRFAGRIIEKPIINQDSVIAYSQGDNSLYFLNYDDGKVSNRIIVADEEEIVGNPIILNNFVIVTTNKGLKAFSSGSCKNLTAAGK